MGWAYGLRYGDNYYIKLQLMLFTFAYSHPSLAPPLDVGLAPSHMDSWPWHKQAGSWGS